MEPPSSRGWVVAGGSIQGPIRNENQDAYAICEHGIGVFDGVGGLPHGKAGADAAAKALPQALLEDEPLERLHRAVKRTGGASTAAVVRWDPLDAWSVGDSWIIQVDDGHGHAMTPSDGVGHALTQCLGLAEVDAHRAPLRVSPGSTLLLVSDGVHRVLELESLERIATTHEPAAAVAEALRRVEAAGAPDNATVVIARRAQA